MRKHFNDQDFNGNRLHNVGAPAAAADAANKAYVDAHAPVIYHFDGDDMTDSAGNTVTAQDIADSVDAGKAVMVLSSEGKLYTLAYAETTESPLTLNFSLIHDDIEYHGGPQVRTIYYDEVEGWVAERTFLWNRVYYGITNTPESTPTKTVELIEPDTCWITGQLLLLHFTYGVPAGYGNAISVGGATYVLTYHQYGITTAGVINAGDKVLLYCYNSVAHVIAIDRWGADIAGKQDLLVSSGAGQNIKTINNSSLLGSGNLTLLPTFTHHSTSITTAGSTTTVTCAADERAFHFVQVGAANCTLRINILNGCDNTVLVSGNRPVDIVILHNGTQVTTLFEAGDYFDGVHANLAKGPVKLVVTIVDGKAVVDVDIMAEYNPSV